MQEGKNPNNKNGKTEAVQVHGVTVKESVQCIQDGDRIPHILGNIKIRRGDNHFPRKPKFILPPALLWSFVLFTSRMIFMPLIHTDKISHLNGLQREKMEKNRSWKKITFIRWAWFTNYCVKGFTGEQGRAFCRQSGFILIHQPNQHLQDVSFTNNTK